MAVTITGGKYAVATLSSAGTTTVTCTGTPFTTSDFTVPRVAYLFNNGLTTFKGMAFVRKANSTSVLELETEFFDPKTGSTVTQVAGGSPDKIYVSKNWADVATTGISVSGRIVTVSDSVTFGTASDPDSCFFHDEAMIVSNTLTSTYARCYQIAGGVVSFGHLQSYTNRTVFGGCTFLFSAATTGCNAFYSGSSSAALLVFGGQMKGAGTIPTYFGGGWDTGSVTVGTDYYYLWALNVDFVDMDVMGLGSGGTNWSTGSNHVVESCNYTGSGTNQNLLRWANGTIRGGTFKFTNGSTAPLAVFGGGSGTFTIGAPAGERLVVLDIADNSLSWWTPQPTNTFNYTNVISTSYRSSYGIATNPSPNPNSTQNVYFLDTYTNLVDASVLALIRDSDWSIDDSDTASGSASSVSLTAFRSTSTGHTAHTSRGPWTYRIRKYGYDGLEGAVTESDYSLGTAGTAKNVSFGGLVNQIANANMSGTAATALAIAGITVTDHGASPVTWNSKSWSITITVDRTTYPSRTAAEVYRHIMAGIAQTSTFNGKVGLLWHELVDTDGSTYSTQRGISGGAGASLKGVRVVTDTGDAMPGFTAMVADDGTTYNPPDLVYQSVELSGLVSGSRVQIYDLKYVFTVSGVTVTPTAGATYTNNGVTFTVISASITAGSGTVTMRGLGVPGSSGTLTKASGTGDATLTFSAYSTTGTELDNAVVSGTTHTWTDTSVAADSRVIRLRVAYQSGTSAKHFIDTLIGTCGITSGTETVTYLVSQTDDDVYNANAINGSAVTGITIDDSLDLVQIAIAGGAVTWAQIYAYQVYWNQTTAGIRDDGAIIDARDQANYRFIGFNIKNTSSGPVVPLVISGGYGVDDATGASIDMIDATGGTIILAPDHALVVTTGSGPLTPTQEAQLAAAAGAPSASAVADAVWSKTLP